MSPIRCARVLVASVYVMSFAVVAAHAGDDDTASVARSWKATIAPAAEPGDRMFISGVVYGPDGETPLKGVNIYLYHTDVDGLYGEGTRASQAPRLAANVRTDSQGRYAYETIKPGPYPSGGTPAHVHHVLSTESGGEQSFEIFFEGDPYLSAHTRALAEKGEVCSIVTLKRDDDGVWHGRCDIIYRSSAR